MRCAKRCKNPQIIYQFCRMWTNLARVGSRSTLQFLVIELSVSRNNPSRTDWSPDIPPLRIPLKQWCCWLISCSKNGANVRSLSQYKRTSLNIFFRARMGIREMLLRSDMRHEFSTVVGMTGIVSTLISSFCFFGELVDIIGHVGSVITPPHTQKNSVETLKVNN